MEITLTGGKEEIRRWIRRQERMTGKKINYTGVHAESGTCVYFVQEGTEKDYPRQRIVRKYIEGQNRSARESSESMLSSEAIESDSEELMP